MIINGTNDCKEFLNSLQQALIYENPYKTESIKEVFDTLTASCFKVTIVNEFLMQIESINFLVELYSVNGETIGVKVVDSKGYKLLQLNILTRVPLVFKVYFDKGIFIH